MIEHCISALREYNRDQAFRRYVATGLYAIVNHTSQYSMTYDEMMNPQTEEQKQKQIQDNKKEAKRIQNRILDKLRGN